MRLQLGACGAWQGGTSQREDRLSLHESKTQTHSPQTENSPTLLKTAKEKNQGRNISSLLANGKCKTKNPSSLSSKFWNNLKEERNPTTTGRIQLRSPGCSLVRAASARVLEPQGDAACGGLHLC